MKVWRVGSVDQSHEHQGFSWHETRPAALAEVNRLRGIDHDPTVEEIDIQVSRDGLLAALRRYAVHPNNEGPR